LELLATAGGPIFIELKSESDKDANALAVAVCRTVDGTELKPRVIIKSFHLGVLSLVKYLLPRAQTAALFAPRIMRFLRKEKYVIDISRECGADHVSIHRSLLSKGLVRKAARFGMPVTVWTADSSRWIRAATRSDVFALITNDPQDMLAARERYLQAG
jgi:glycerophosphoryl diester phosphodiesterase